MKIKAIDIATNKLYNFSPRYRYGKDPEYIRVPPNSTDGYAFLAVNFLEHVKEDELVFIEWKNDHYYEFDDVLQDYVVGPTVWRLSRIKSKETK